MHAHLPQSARGFTTAVLPEGSLGVSGARRAFAAFYVSGILMGFPGAILLSWQHHLRSDYGIVGLYFLGMIAGLVLSAFASPRLLESKGVGWTLSLACAVAGIAFLALAFVSPPWSHWWRVGGMALLGASAGLLHTAVFHAISPMYRHNPVATVNLAGMLFGLGCLTDAALIGMAYYNSSVPVLQVWLAVLPAAFGWLFWKSRFSSEPVPHHPPHRTLFVALKDAGAVLLSLLLFFQLCNEWAVAGWLPLFLTQRLGIRPTAALWMLAFYWLALLVGRVVAQWILPHIRHSRLLLACVLIALMGGLVLSETNNAFGAYAGILMLGASFAPIYPLVVEKIGMRFPYYHPGFYNGLFSFALAGGFLAPAVLGFVASQWGIGSVMMFPMAGAAAVCLLLVLIWLEARLSVHARAVRL